MDSLEGKEIMENIKVLIAKIPFLMRERPWENFLCHLNRKQINGTLLEE